MAPLIQPRLLKGFRDTLPDVMIARRRMIDTVCRVFESFGFVPLDTPALEYAEILLGKYGTEGEKLLYRFKDNGGRDVALRYDLTVPLARVAAQYRDLARPLRRYQIGPVWRAEAPQRGRFREFLQCDVDIVGTPSLLADAECVAVDAAVMRALDVDVQIRLNNRKVFRGLQTMLAVDSEEQFVAVLRAIDKLDRDGESKVRKQLARDAELGAKAIDTLFGFLTIEGDNDSKIDEAEAQFKCAGVEAGLDGLAELRDVLTAAADLGVPEKVTVVDLAIARGLDYYTGTVFETIFTALPEIGSVMSGGRYDDLVSIFLGELVPAVGISVGLDRLLAALEELGRLEKTNATAAVYVSLFNESLITPTLDCVRQLRDAGVNVEMAYAPGKLRKQIKAAVAKDIPFLVILGPDEASEGKLTLRDLDSGQQDVLTLEEAIARIRSRGTVPTGELRVGPAYNVSVSRDTGLYAVGSAGPEAVPGGGSSRKRSAPGEAGSKAESAARTRTPPDVAAPRDPDGEDRDRVSKPGTSTRRKAYGGKSSKSVPPAVPPDVAAPRATSADTGASTGKKADTEDTEDTGNAEDTEADG